MSTRPDETELAAACGRGDLAAIELFEKLYFPSMNRWLGRLALPTEALSELAQLIRIKLFVPDKQGHRRISEYASQGELEAWFRVLVLREGLAFKRRQKPEEPAEDDVLQGLIVQETPDLIHLRNLYGPALRKAFGDAVDGLTPRDRNILRHHFVDKLSIDDIGAIYRVHRATADRWLLKIRQTLALATRDALAKQFAMSSDALQSVLRMLRSHIDLSIERLLR